MSNIDLHLHTAYSDGTETPQQMVRRAAECGLNTIAITDHDTLAGLDEGTAAARRWGLRFIPGIELTADLGTTEIHILGYFVSSDREGLRAHIQDYQQARTERNRRLLLRLAELGMPLRLSDLQQLTCTGIITRLHIARGMVQQGYTPSVIEAFRNWMLPGRPAFVPKAPVSPIRVVRLLRDEGAIPVLAHPGQYRRDDAIPQLVDAGLAGLEVYHSRHNERSRSRYRALAHRYGLVVTGGSDCHGWAKDDGPKMGTVSVPEEVVENLDHIHRSSTGQNYSLLEPTGSSSQ